MLLLHEHRIGDVARLQGELDALGEVAAPAELERQVGEAMASLSIAAVEAEQARDILQKARTDEAVAARSYEDAIAGVPKSLRVEGALERDGATIAASIKALRGALAGAEERLRKAATARDTTAAKLIGAVDAAAQAEAEVAKRRSAFDARLAEIGLDRVRDTPSPHVSEKLDGIVLDLVEQQLLAPARLRNCWPVCSTFPTGSAPFANAN